MLVEIKKLTCLHCSHTWVPKQSDVRSCPSCRSYNWDKPKKEKTNVEKKINKRTSEGDM